MSNPSKCRVLLALFMVSVMLIGCGGDNTPAASNPTTAPAAAAKPSSTLPSGPSNGGGGDVGVEATYDVAYGKLMADVNSYHFILLWERKPGAGGTTTTDGDVDSSNKLSAQANFKVSNSDEAGSNGEWARNSTRWYHKVGGKWQESTNPPSTGMGVDVLYPASLLQNPVGSEGTTDKLVGSDMVESQDCNHYQAVREGDTYDSWVSKQSGLFVRIKKSNENYSTTLTLSNINQPVTLDLPK